METPVAALVGYNMMDVYSIIGRFQNEYISVDNSILMTIDKTDNHFAFQR